MPDNEPHQSHDEQIQDFLGFVGQIRKTATAKGKKLNTESSVQKSYALALYSRILELAGDTLESIKARKMVTSPILLRSLLEAVVELSNTTNHLDYVKKRALTSAKQKKKHLKNIQKYNPLLEKITEKNITKIDDVLSRLVNSSKKDLIKKRFEGAKMLEYYETTYSALCNYAHHDFSVMINQEVMINNENASCITDNFKSLSLLYVYRFSNLLADLLLKASFEIHTFLESDHVIEFKTLSEEHQQRKIRLSKLLKQNNTTG